MPHPSVHARPAAVSLEKPRIDVDGSRPKFSRRPASFYQEPSKVTPTPVAAGNAPAIAASPWQEDIGFGILLVATLLIVNIALSYLIPQLAPPTNRHDTQAIKAFPAAMPHPTDNDTSRVTTYSQPPEAQVIRQQLDLHTSDDMEPLSISPEDFPPPKAQPLESTDQGSQ